MDIDALEVGGGVAAGAVGAGMLDGSKGAAGEHVHKCADCGAVVTSKFCGECGQSAHVHRTLFHLLHELLHGVMHFDGRIWRTLPLLIANPGKLTREWCEGKRTRYVSPLAIFLFTLFLIFMGLSMMPEPKVVEVNGLKTVVQSEKSLEDLKAQAANLDVEIAEVDKAFAASTGSDRISLGTRKGILAGAKATLATQIEALENGTGSQADPNAPRTDGLVPGSWQSQVADLRWENDGKGVMAKIGKKLKNPDLMVYKLQQTAYKFSFLLVPLSIPFMWLLFLWRRGYTLYDHGVFVLYSLTFMAILALVAVSVGRLLPGLVEAICYLVMLVVPVHMFAQLKGAYSLSIVSALWRTLFLQVFCTIVMGLFLVAIVYLGLGH